MELLNKVSKHDESPSEINTDRSPSQLVAVHKIYNSQFGPQQRMYRTNREHWSMDSRNANQFVYHLTDDTKRMKKLTAGKRPLKTQKIEMVKP